MRFQYRLLQLIPDFRRPDVVTIGALLHTGSSVSFVEAPTLPGAECLGSVQAQRALDHILISINRTGPEDWWEKVPEFVGNQLVLGDSIHADISRPKKWIQAELLPSYKKTGAKIPRRHRRSTLGKRFFQHHGVGGFVETRFNLKSLYFTPGSVFPSFSLASMGEDRSLVIEPLKFGRKSYGSDVKQVANDFQSAKFIQQTHKDSFGQKPLETMTLLLPGVTDEARELAENSVGESSDYLIDTRFEGDRALAVELVRSIGESSSMF